MRYIILCFSCFFFLVSCGKPPSDNSIRVSHLLNKPVEEYSAFEKAILYKNIEKVEKILDEDYRQEVNSDHITLAIQTRSLAMVEALFPTDNKVDTGLGVLSIGAAVAGLVAIPFTAGTSTFLVAAAVPMLSTFGVLSIGSGRVFSKAINYTNSLGELPLHVAIKEGSFNIVEYFVDGHNAWIFLEDNQGLDAVELAQKENRTKIKDFLEDERLSIDQIRQVIMYTKYLSDTDKSSFAVESLSAFRTVATKIYLEYSDEEKEKLYKYARKQPYKEMLSADAKDILW